MKVSSTSNFHNFGSHSVRKLFVKIPSRKGMHLSRFTLQDGHIVTQMSTLEELEDPRNFIKELRNYLINKKAKKIIFKKTSSSLNVHKYRQYSLSEVKKLLLNSGFLVSSNSNKEVIAEATADSYEKFLEDNDMPPASVRHLFLTTEHPEYKITGGIGSYVKEAHTQYGEKISTVLLVDTNENYDETLIGGKRWLSMQKLISPEAVDYYQKNDHGKLGDALLESVKQVIFYYDNLEVVELSDFDDLAGFRIIQAKQTGLLPQEIQLVTVCHGSTLYTSNGARTTISPLAMQTMLREAFSIRNADKTIFLTNFVKDLYESYGLYARNPIYDRLPLDYQGIPYEEVNNLDDVKQIVYIGKPTKTKGFDLFLQSLIDLAENTEARKIKNVICFTTFTGIIDPEIEALMAKVHRYYNIVIESLPRVELFNRLSQISKDSLVLVTYPADNHPNVVLELMALGVDFLAADAGGIPELVNPKTKKHFLVKPTPKDFSNMVVSIRNNRTHRLGLIKQNREWFINEQEKINKSYNSSKIRSLAKPTASTAQLRASGKDISVIVPCYNTDLNQVSELCESLENQSITPNEVIFVNDGSTTPGYLKKLKNKVYAHYSGKTVFINKKNGGLASARNAGLEKAVSKFIVTIDSDDIVTNSFLEDLLRAKLMNPQAIGVTPYLSDFVDGKADPSQFNPDAYEYHPTGSSLATAFFPSNFFGSAAAIFNREELLNLTGGWDESDKSMWEDWSLYTKLACLGKHVLVLPKICYIYRVRQDSMVRTYSQVEGVKRLIRNYTAMPQFDAYLLYSQQKYLDDLRHGRYPLEIWNPITEHARRQALAEFEKRYGISKIKRLAYLTRKFTRRKKASDNKQGTSHEQ